MKSKRSSIGNKLFRNNLIMLFAILLIFLLAFNFIFRAYLIRESQNALDEQAKTILKTLDEMSPPKDVEREFVVKGMVRRNLQMIGKLVDTEIVFLDEKKIVYSSQDGIRLRDIQDIIDNQKGVSKNYVYRRVKTEKLGAQSFLLIYNEISTIKSVNRILLMLSFIALGIGLVLAVIFAYLTQKRLLNPLKKLNSTMKNLDLKNYKEIDIKTNDEIEDLADSFNAMTRKIKDYDENQRKFFQNTSHELKTPLMSIKGYAEAIKDGIVTEAEELDESLDVIISESERLNKLVQEIIYLTKLETKSEMYDFKEIDLKNLLNESARLYKNEKSTVNIKSETDNLFVKGDFDKLKIVLTNIITNCQRYAESNIDIELIKKSNSIEILIEDDGKGFLNGEENLIFQRFYKSNSSGSGLGLSISKAIIDMHRGEIRAYNNERNGAGFIIKLPLA